MPLTTYHHLLPSYASLRCRLQTPQIPTGIPIPQLLGTKPISQIRKAILLLRRIHKILTPKPLQHMEPMNPTPRMQRRNRTILFPVLEPGATGASPCRARHERIDMFVEIVECFVGGREGEDGFGLAFVDYVRDIGCDVLCYSED
jgi:hypothetical protein